MPRKSTPLTDTEIKNTKKQNKDYALSDGKGLQLLIKSSGVKSWEFRYNSPTLQKRRKTSLGSYPDVTLANARKKRNIRLELISQGIDPIDYYKEQNKLKEQQSNNNFKQIAEDWLNFDATKTIADTNKKKRSMFKNSIYPFLENQNIEDITHQDIIEVIKAKEKQGYVESASRMFSELNTVWKFAITKGLCKYNPFQDIMKDLVIIKKEVKHYAKITDEKLLIELINKIHGYQGHYSVRSALLFVLHVPLRADNLCNLKWEHINFEDKLLTIPRKLMKVKNTNLPDYRIPLSEQVIKILQEQYLLTGYQSFVFLSKGKYPINKESPNRALQLMGCIEEKKQTTHSFRGTFRSLIETHQKQHNATYDTKERALDHQETKKQVRAYSNKADYTEQLKPLMQWWSNYLHRLGKVVE
ncbi:MAG: integrase [Sulfurimonas sp.]|jgi:integrase|uniref:tyrosine-type recombinase/integrase n=1 Tax=Sulfurimonas sp. TaxID=2022749 RepID=UPI0039E726EE